MNSKHCSRLDSTVHDPSDAIVRISTQAHVPSSDGEADSQSSAVIASSHINGSSSQLTADEAAPATSNTIVIGMIRVDMKHHETRARV
jgi:hypothetical protein